MNKKSYAVMNLSFDDDTRNSDYLLEQVQGKTKYNLPVNMLETHKMYPSELTELICVNTLTELEHVQTD